MIWTVLGPIATVAIYFALRRVHRGSIVTLPVLATSVLLVALLALPGGDLAGYERGTMPLKFLLGPATLALAVPLAKNRAILRRRALLAVLIGAVVGAVSAVLLCRWLKLSPVLTATLAPKSVTTPIAMPIAARTGGIPELTAAIVILVGVLGMVVGPWLLDRIGVRSRMARGLALGTAAHGVGTAQALSESEETGAAAGVAMVVAGIVTAIIVPILLQIPGR
jgi:predicted murein hydrolase (TIGR00659 family)